MSQHEIRVMSALVGDVTREPNARVKYALLFEALSRKVALVDIYDASLKGVDRFTNALQVFSANRQQWRQRFHQNVPAFRTRSQRIAEYLKMHKSQIDVVLQLGVLFDAKWIDDGLPHVIYTDYTAALAARNVYTGRSPFTPAQREQWLTLERQTYERAAHICTRSRYVRQSIIDDYGIAPDCVSAIGGGLNFEDLPDLVIRSGHAAPTALFIGKDFYRKGGDLLLQAFAHVRQHLPDAQLLMVTNRPAQIDLPTDGVTFIEPTWDRTAIMSYYRRADLFVLPSRLETWGDVLLEAMAFGLPCIGVHGESMKDIIQHEATGLLVPPEDSEPLAKALVRLLSDRDTCRRWGINARQQVKSAYTWEHVAAQLVTIIEKALH